MCADFFKWHKEWGVTLLEIYSRTALELVENWKTAFPTFYIKITVMGLWKEKYVLQSESFGIKEHDQGIKTNRIWLSDSNTTSYKNCELFLQELLSSDELWEIILLGTERESISLYGTILTGSHNF